MASSRDYAKRFISLATFNSSIYGSHVSKSNCTLSPNPSTSNLERPLRDEQLIQQECGPQYGSRRSSMANSNDSNGLLSPSAHNVRTLSGDSHSSTNSGADVSQKFLPEEVPVATGNGIQVYITLAEPILFLQGFEHSELSSSTTAMLRGSLILRVTKSVKIKAITLNFRGKARTEWPEGLS